MLPNEVGKLFDALNESKETSIDAPMLCRELAGIAEFNRALINGGRMSEWQRELFAKHVARYIDPNCMRGNLSITAPPSGPPKVLVQITAPPGGIPPVSGTASSRSVECPNCHLVFTPKS